MTANSKYDLQAIRSRLLAFLKSERPALSDEAPDFESVSGEWRILNYVHTVLRVIPVWENLARCLYATLDAAYPRHDHRPCPWVEYGDSSDLTEDYAYSCGVCGYPDPTIQIREAYVRLWHPKLKTGPLWVFFTEDGIEFCKTSRWRKGMVFAMKPFLKWGWEDPTIFREVNRWLRAVGFGVEWSPGQGPR